MQENNLFEAVKQNMLSMMKYSKIEFKEYKATGNIIYLQQAGEKLFNATENYIQYLYKIQSNSFQGVQNIIKEKSLRKLLYDMKRLHQFFYNAELSMTIEDAEDEYIRLSTILEQRIKRLK